jgi:hypothetical protein
MATHSHGDEVVDRFAEFIQQRTAGRELICPIDGSKEWVVGTVVGQVAERAGPGWGQGSGPIYPLGAIFCRTCGYARFFNLVIAGLLEHEEGVDSQ